MENKKRFRKEGSKEMTFTEIIKELTTVHRISRQLYSNGKVYYGTAKSLRLNGFKIPLEELS